MARNYRREYLRYHSKPSQIKRRAKRNAARRLLVKEGRVHKGDGKDIDHIDRNPANNAHSNLRVTSKKTNRSRNQQFQTSMKHITSIIELSGAQERLNAIIEFAERRTDYWARLQAGNPAATANVARPDQRAAAQNEASKHAIVQQLKYIGGGVAAGGGVIGGLTLLAKRNPKGAGRLITRIARRVENGKDGVRDAVASKFRDLARMRINSSKDVKIAAGIGATAGAYMGVIPGAISGQIGSKATDIYNKYANEQR